MREAIRRRAHELGFNDCRFTTAEVPESSARFSDWLGKGKHGEMGYLAKNAAKRTDPSQVLPGARSIITLLSVYSTDPPRPRTPPLPPQKIQNQGLIARYAHGPDYHEVLKPKLKALVEFITAVAGQTTRSLWYTDTGPILERDFAQRAGLGFIGKHNNLISRRFGNYSILSEIITTLALTPDDSERNRCGTCELCIEACPTSAILGPFDLDARRCISYLTIELKGSIPVEFRPLIGNRIFGCDDCLEVCPWNRFAREARVTLPREAKALNSPRLLELLALDEAGFNARFQNSPVLRSRRRGLLRNVCVALGNVGDHSAKELLEKISSEADPLLAEHAQWAIKEIEKRTGRISLPDSRTSVRQE